MASSPVRSLSCTDPVLSRRPMVRAPFLTIPWILLLAYLNCVGWLLSAFHQLNATGYIVAIAIGIAVFWANRSKIDWGRIRWRRFRRAFPLCFLVLTAIAVLGGVFYLPSNYDGLAYRIPRVLHWLAEGNWHWIHTAFARVNTRATGWEWTAAPLIALTKSYRGVAVINMIAFCTMPGLVFSFLRQMGISPRVAWHWMWIIPTGYCFILQAGSISNDMVGAVFALAAVVLALNAWHSGQISDLWLSALSIALCTAFKTSNLPLLLPWAVACLPALPLLKKRICSTLAILPLAVGASLLPTLALNQIYCGDWTGLKVEYIAFNKNDPLLYLPTNAILLTIQNLEPPVFPMASIWNRAERQLVPPDITNRLEKIFEKGAAHFLLPEMQIEENAGLGFGVSALLLISLGAGLFFKGGPRRAEETPRASGRLFALAILLAPWVSLLFFMQNSALTTVGRLIAPYYALVIPLFLIGRWQSDLVRKQWWRVLAYFSFATALLLVVLSPSRPFWPAQTVINQLDAEHSSNSLLRHAYCVYDVYRDRGDSFAPAVAALPPGLRKLGIVTADDPEASLWNPIGARRVIHVTRDDTAEDMRRKGVEYILASSVKVPMLFSKPIDQWIQDNGFVPVENIKLSLRAHDGATNWVLVRVPSAN